MKKELFLALRKATKKIIDDIDETNLLTSTLKITKHKAKISDQFYSVMEKLGDAQFRLDMKTSEVYEDIARKHQTLFKTKAERDIKALDDEDYRKIYQEVQWLETVAKALEQMNKDLKDAGYSIKNTMDYKKFLAGG